MRQKVFSILALLLVAATGAWAEDIEVDGGSRTICDKHAQLPPFLSQRALYTKRTVPTVLQIIPSCGMNIRPDAVVARNGGFVFNCDGEYELGATAEVKGVNGKNSHTSLCSVDNDELSEAYNVDADLQITDTNLKDLFRNDTFNIHIYKSIEIKL